MQYLAHRGLWSTPEQRNRPDALEGALREGFGIETDLRDRDGGLAIAHDPGDPAAFDANRLFDLYAMLGSSVTMALNIKADGLRGLLKPVLERFGVRNYFCFDMSVPETLAYHREDFRFFTRESEYERTPALYEAAKGVWMDMFHSDWVAAEDIRRHLDAGKEVALVSPELHGRTYGAAWQALRNAGLANAPGLMLCTDFPLQAREFFDA